MSNFTVVKKGQEIQFESAFSDLEVAKYYLQENLSGNTFACDLVSKKKLSDKQIAWIHYLATENLQESLNKEKIEGEFLSLVEKMYSAVKGKVRNLKLRLPGVTLSTVSRGSNVGCVYIIENDIYAGKITDRGILQAKVSEDTRNILLDANDNLLQLAKIYGHETGNCSVCGRTLSDPLSVQMGIGPICAERFS
jgi:hypothetical protein